MKRTLSTIAVTLWVSAIAGAGAMSGGQSAQMSDALDITMTSLEGQQVDLTQYRGKVALIVNVASACVYTPQYAGLQSLHEQYGDRGLTILGFPSNDFGGQEPGNRCPDQGILREELRGPV